MSPERTSAEENGGIARIFLRYAQAFAWVRNVPVLGPAARWASGKLVPRGTLSWVQVRHGVGAGLWMRVNPRTGGQTLQGTGEPAVQDALQKNLRPGMIFFDLGANIGFFSLIGARLVGAAGRVVSFEADPEIAARLRENVAKNGFEHVAVEQRAVWSEPRMVTFARVDTATSPDRGQGHVSSGEAGGDVISVEAVSLDDYCRSGPAPDFIKCDVEGAEIEVFRGAKCVFAEKRPIFLCELHGEEQRRMLTAELSALGYRCTDCDATHLLALPQ